MLIRTVGSFTMIFIHLQEVEQSWRIRFLVYLTLLALLAFPIWNTHMIFTKKLLLDDYQKNFRLL